MYARMLVCLIGTFFTVQPLLLLAQAKKTPQKKTVAVQDSSAVKKDSLATLVKSKTKIEGLFTIFQDSTSGSIQLYVKKKQVGEAFIYQSFSMGGPGSLFLNQNMLRETWVFTIKKSFNRLEFLHSNTNYYYDSANAVSKAAYADVGDAVFYADKIIAEDSAGYLINADGLFLSEKLDAVRPNYPITVTPGSLFNLGSLAADKSGYEKIRSFPNNTDVVVSLAYDNPTPLNYGDRSITDARYVRVKMQHSFIEMPKNDFRPRFDDPRIGFFTQQMDDMTSAGVTNYHDLISRWNLVKKDPSATISEPVEPIVWWVENTTPVELRQIILDAGSKWNEAFEHAGFKNAVIMKMMPDTATWDPADIRYNVIRWVSSDLGYAIGPSFINPRTGQILGADITIDYGFMNGTASEESLFNTAQPTGSAITASTLQKHYLNCSIGQQLKMQYAAGGIIAGGFDASQVELDSLKKQFFTELVLHEMGHTMGLMHNMKSSQMLSPDELNDKSVTRKKGVTGSVMDYSTVNAALDHSKQGDYYTTKTGPYDWWAIEYGYSTFSPAEEKAALQKILSRSAEPQLAFGNDADILGNKSGIDPRVSTWDMSNDMVTYGDNRFKLVNQLIGRLKNRYAKPGYSYADLRQKYLVLLSQRYSMAIPLSKYIGGVFVDRSFAGQPGATQPFTPVPADYQKKALAVLNEHVFAPTAFDADAYLLPFLQTQRRSFDLATRPEDARIEKYIGGMQMSVLDFLLDDVTLARINRTSLYGNSYSVTAVLADITNMLFDADLKTSVNLYRQNVQAEYVKKLSAILLKGDEYDNASKAAVLYAIKNIQRKLAKSNSPDEQSEAHRANLSFIIEKALVIK